MRERERERLDTYQISHNRPHTLHTLIEQELDKKKGKAYACSVDFTKAFDSIWHEGLFYRLLNSGIGGKTYDVIKSMYTNSKCAVKIGDKQPSLPKVLG